MKNKREGLAFLLELEAELAARLRELEPELVVRLRSKKFNGVIGFQNQKQQSNRTLCSFFASEWRSLSLCFLALSFSWFGHAKPIF